MRAKALAGGLLFLCALAVGCGDDGDGNDDGGAGDGAGSGGASGAGSGGTGGRPTLPDPDGGSGTGGSGGDASTGDEGEEGFPCLTDADCGLAENGEALSCVESGFQDFGVCARPCTGDPSCASDEVCLTLGGVDPRCTNLINEEFALCGIVETSDCAPEAGLVCLYLPQQPYGVCTTLCESGGDADGGAPNEACDADQFCRGDVVQSSEQDPRDGVCGMHAARGEECGIFLGMFCGDADVCGPESLPVGDETKFVCLEDCTMSPDVCDEGKTCTSYMGSFLCM